MIKNIKLEKSWKHLLRHEFNKEYMKKLEDFLTQEKLKYCIYPNTNQIFKSLNSIQFQKIKVVLIGQDPYHSEGQANGYAFSVPTQTKHPPSLANIFKELENDLNIKNNNGDLTSWATQGVLLLNSTLTVRKHMAGSHQKKGWETFTNEIISLISQKRENIVFFLWGKKAKEKISIIDDSKHLVLTSSHPSPLSSYRGFFGCQHFSKCNKYLKTKNIKNIDWKTY